MSYNWMKKIAFSLCWVDVNDNGHFFSFSISVPGERKLEVETSGGILE